jgi:hypothetical protein
MSELPTKGEVYHHKTLRGSWIVQSCGPQWITLKPSLPQLENKRLHTCDFVFDRLSADPQWERIR